MFANGERLDKAQKARVRQLTHRYHTIFAFDGGVFLLEVREANKLRVPCVLDPSSNELHRFPQVHIFKQDGMSARSIYVDGVVGSYASGIIAMVSDPNVVDALVRLTGGAGQAAKLTDNPSLLFLNLTPPLLHRGERIEGHVIGANQSVVDRSAAQGKNIP